MMTSAATFNFAFVGKLNNFKTPVAYSDEN